MNSVRSFLATLVFVLPPAIIGADASGPDSFRVVGVAPTDVLNIRSEASYRAPKIGQIPSDGRGIRNFGCVGGMSFSEWEQASSTERQLARKRIWCEVEYRGIRGWVAGWYIREDDDE